jgi:ribulose-phosphate 3-epimerase
MFEIIPGILEKEWTEIEKKIETVKSFAKIIHLDVIDGQFAGNTTFLDPKPFQKYTKDIFFEVHLMVDEPINYLESFAHAGFKRFIGHIEKMSSQEEFVAKAESLGEVSLALDADSSVESLKAQYEDLDSVLIMSVKAGLSGQNFLPEVLAKVTTIKNSFPLPVEIDGGINNNTIIQAKNAGVERFVATSFIFSGDPKENYQKLLSAVSQV